MFRAINVPVAAFALAIAGLPFLLGDKYIFHVAILAGIYIVLTVSLNLLLGYTGLFSLGHAAFYGIGAYASALLTLKLQLPFLIAFPVSGLITALVGVAVGFPALRIKGIFLAIGTMGFNEIVRLLLINWEGLTGGPAGLPAIPKPDIFGYVLAQPQDYYVAMLVFIAVTLLIFDRLISTRPGRALVAIRDDQIAARAVGINITGYKVTAFAVAAFFAGLAGSFFAHYLTYISPDNFGLNESFALVAMVALGGMGKLAGSVVGASLLAVIPEAFRFLQDYREFIYGSTIVLIMYGLPDGILAWYPGFKQKICRRRGFGRAG